MTDELSPGHGSPLAQKCHTAVLAILTEGSLKAAARKAGVSEVTLRKWLRIPAFQALLDEARQQSFAAGLARLQGVAMESVQVLAKVMRSKKELARDKVKAALGLLDIILKAGELSDLQARLKALENELKES